MERTGQVFERIGERVGFFATRTAQRLQGFRRGSHQEPHQDEDKQPQQRDEREGTPRMERAEVWADRIGSGLTQFTALASLQALRVGARVREEVEDIWAEAQVVRGSKKSPGPTDTEKRETKPAEAVSAGTVKAPETGEKTEKRQVEVHKEAREEKVEGKQTTVQETKKEPEEVEGEEGKEGARKGGSVEETGEKEKKETGKQKGKVAGEVEEKAEGKQEEKAAGKSEVKAEESSEGKQDGKRVGKRQKEENA